MSQETPLSAPLWNDSGDMHRGTYRVFCVIAAVLVPIFGVVYQITDPGAFDPMWGRLGMSVVLLLLLSLSYMVEGVERNFIVLVRGYFYLLITYLVGVTALNGFAPNYTLGMLFGFTATGVAFSLGLRRRTGALKRYLAFTVVLMGATAAAVPAPLVSLWIAWGCVASTALIIFVVAEAKVRAEESVEASEHRFHTLMNAANDAIVISDPDTNRLVDVNQKALELVGRTADEVRQMRLSDLFPAASRERSSALFNAHVFGKQPIPEDLFVSDGRGGTTAVDVSASLIDVDGRQLVQGIFRDVTDRHRYESQLIQAKERAEDLLGLKTSLLNNMSHELRTPLTAILGFAELLTESADDGQREYAEHVLHGAERLYDTVNSVLGLAQLEAGAPTLEVRPVDVAGHLREALELLRPLADQKGIGLRLDVRTARAHAETDAACLGRIVNNLVGNAIKFTDDGEVTVEVSAHADRVVVRVRDTGVGISESFLPHLFEEFQQESTGLARSHEGSGLGLTITKRLVEVLGGEIAVESEKGAGSTFAVTLPRAAAPATPEARPARPAPPAASSEHRLLVVEDNPDTRELIAQRLGPVCQLELAADPEAAIALAEATAFDAFLLDINLTATLDGVDVLHALRAMPAYADTPTVAMTAYAMPGDRERFLNAGFDHYLSKPFTSQQLQSLVADLFSDRGAAPPEDPDAPIAGHTPAYRHA